MPLVKTILLHELKKIMDPDYPAFEGFPTEKVLVAERWASAIHMYAQLVIPATTSGEAAKSALIAAWQSLAVDASIAFPAGFSVYATALALGMQPTFTGAPPVVPIVLAPVFTAGLAGASGAECAEMMADIIDIWFKTGTATNNSSGATVTWN